MPKVFELKNRKGSYAHYCPGCDETHVYCTNAETARKNSDGSMPLWTFNGDLDNPSFTPSMNYVGYCHYFVTDGKIIYQGDCKHELKGQTVELPEFKDWPEEYQVWFKDIVEIV